MKTKLTSIALLALSLACTTSCGGNKQIEQTIRIGLSGPLSGDAAAYGCAVRDSAQLAVDEINAKGGLNGVKFSLDALDDQLDAVAAQTNYVTLKEKGMQVSLAAVTSGACLAFGTEANKDGLFCLTPSATNDAVPTTGVYQMCFNDSAQGSLAAKFIETNYPSAKVGIFYDSSDDYSTGIYDNFIAAFSGKVEATASFTKASNTSFTAQIKTLENCDFIFMPIYYTQASIFVAQAKDSISKDAIYFGCDGLDGIAGVEGFNADIYPQEISYLSHFNPESSFAADYIANFTKNYPNTTLNQFGAAAYDCVYAIFEGMKKSSITIDGTTSAKAIGDELRKVFQDPSFVCSGATGTAIKWNADGTVNKEPNKYVVNPNRTK